MNVRTTKLKIKFLLYLAVVLFTIISVVFVVYKYYTGILKSTKTYSAGIADISVTMCPSDKVDAVLQNGVKDESYDDLSGLLLNVKQTYPDVDELRILKVSDDKTLFCVLDIYSEDERKNQFVYEYGLKNIQLDNMSVFEPVFEMVELERKDDWVIIEDEEGEKYAFAYSPIIDENDKISYVVQVAVNMREQLDDIASFLYINLFFGIICDIFFFYVISYIINRFIFWPLEKATQKWDEEFFPENVKGINERIEWLAESINEYQKRVYDVEAQNRELTSELELATHVRLDLLPHIVPTFKDLSGVELSARLEPAKRAGGAFYDFYMIDKEHLALVSADVEGSGASAALFMIIAKTLIKNNLQAHMNARDVLDVTNNQLCDSNNAALFVSAWIGVLNVVTGYLEYASAAHPAPLLIDGDGMRMKFDEPKESMPIGAWEDAPYELLETYIKKGQTVAIYNQGISDAVNEADEEYGVDRLYDIIQSNSEKSLDIINNTILNNWLDYHGKIMQARDFSFLIFRFKERYTK